MLPSKPSSNELNCEPMNADMMAGGASLAPNRWSFPTLAMDARTTSAWRCNAAKVLTKKVRKRRLVLGLVPGFNKFTPVLVPKDQLLCLPEPFTPAKGFSWSKMRKSWRRATFSNNSINIKLWSLAKLASSKTGANSNWFGATSLWRVVTGMPNLCASISKSFMNADTRSGMAPK